MTHSDLLEPSLLSCAPRTPSKLRCGLQGPEPCSHSFSATPGTTDIQLLWTLMHTEHPLHPIDPDLLLLHHLGGRSGPCAMLQVRTPGHREARGLERSHGSRAGKPDLSRQPGFRGWALYQPPTTTTTSTAHMAPSGSSLQGCSPSRDPGAVQPDTLTEGEAGTP
jgi:hypothetical protein